MQRCVHLYDSGRQCESEALAGSDFCVDHHEETVAFERLDYHPLQKLVVRLVALMLLFIFLFPLYFTVKNLYFGPPIEAQEGW